MVEQAISPQAQQLNDTTKETNESPTRRSKDKGKQIASEPVAEKEGDDEEEGTSENCVICLEVITVKCTTAPCGHAYDYICILHWLELRQNCPLCNATVLEIHTRSRDGRIHKHIIEPPRPSSAPVPSNTPSTFPLRDRRTQIRYRRLQRQRSPPPITEDTAILRRRFVYKHGLRSLYVGSNRMSRFRNVGPRDFREDEELVSRARMWLRRELQVWEWTSSNAEFLIEYVVGILKSVDLKGSAGQAEEMVAEMLGREHAGIFVHELNAFLKSPFTTLRHFDNFVQYEIPIPRHLLPSNLVDQETAPSSSASPARCDSCPVPDSTREPGPLRGRNRRYINDQLAGPSRGHRSHPYRREVERR